MAAARSPLRVAFADDSSESRALLRAMLEVFDGVEVVGAATNGAQAVDLVAAQHPDLVLLDIAMPVMDGLEAAAAIRARVPETKIAMYSAYNRVRMAPAALAAGADDYVEKAATIEGLLAQIQRLFPDGPTLTIRPAAPARPSEEGDGAPAVPARAVEEQRYRMLLDALEEGVLTTDSAGVVSDANFVASRVLDVPLSRMIGHRLDEVGLDGGSEGARTMDEALRRHRPVSGMDYTLIRPDGERRDLTISVRPLHDPASLAVHENIVSFVDLTDLRRSERRLLHVEARMRRSFEAMLDCLVILTAVRGPDGAITDFRYEEANKAACRFNRMERDQLVGHLLCEVLPAHRTNGLFAKFVEVVETGHPLELLGMVFSHSPLPGQRPSLALDIAAVASGDELVVDFRDVTEQRRIQEREREAFEAMLDGLVIMSPIRDDAGAVVDFRFDYVNEAGCRLNGLPREAHLGRPASAVLPGFLESGLCELFAEVLRSGEPLRRRSIFADLSGGAPGVRRVWDINVVSLGDAVLDNFRDVTDQVAAELQRRETEEHLQGAIASMHEAFFLTRARRGANGGITDLEYVTVNDEACRIAGRPAEELVGHGLLELFPEHGPKGLFDRYCTVVETGEPFHDVFTYAAETVDGTFDVTVTKAGDGYLMIGADITEQGNAEVRRREAEERLKLALEAMTEGFYVTRARRDESGTIRDFEYVMVNSAGLRMARRTAEEMIGHGMLELYYGGEPTRTFAEYCTVIETGQPFHEVVSYGGLFNATVEATVTKAGDGFLAVLIDVTERAQREQQLERSNHDLEAFASALSHDLREPLRTTAGFVQLITDRYGADLPAPALELFGYVVSGTERMNDRITSILDFARAGASAAPPHSVDSAAAAAAAARDCEAVLTQAGAALDIGPLPLVTADALQLQRVFQNLLTNAAKYTRDGVVPHLTVSADRLEESWRFTVADNGVGIPEAQRERVFAMFVRGGTDDSLGTRDGLGMGLSVCRRIVESYGGRIWAEANPSGGTLLRFTLLAAASTPVPASR